KEMRRRRVYQTVALYIAGAWVALQVAELAFAARGIDERALSHVWLAAFYLFPLVLVFAWRYDIRSGKVRRTLPAESPEDADVSPRRIDRWFIGGLGTIATGVVALTVVNIVTTPLPLRPPDRPAEENSIAVLPFQACPGHESDAVLAAGMATEVINRLATMSELRVMARASSFTMVGFDLPLTQIAGTLGVKHLLTGEICRDGEMLTLAVELVDEAGYVGWSDSFRQSTDWSGSITTTVAARVAEGIVTSLGHAVASTDENPVNRLAYEQLVIGREYVDRQEFDKARAAFDKALRYDPENAEAIFSLAWVIEREALSEGELGLASIEKAWPVGERALALARSELETGDADFRTHETIAWVLYEMGKWDLHLTWRQAHDLDESELAARVESATQRFAEAESHLRTALSLNASDTSPYGLLGLTLERQGIHRRTEALEIFEAALIRDPFHLWTNRNVSARWAARGRYRQAIELLERFDALPEVPHYAWHARLELQRTQDYGDEFSELLTEMLLRDPGAIEHVNNYLHLMFFPGVLAELGLHDQAEAWYQRVQKINAHEGYASVVRGWGENYYLYATGKKEDDLQENLAVIAGLGDEEILDDFPNAPEWLAEAGEFERAIRLMEAQQHSRFDAPIRAERQPASRIALARLYQIVGRDGDAEKLLSTVVDGLEAEYDDGIRHPTTLAYLAKSYAMQGRDDDALDMLRKAIDYHYRSSPCDPDNQDVFEPWERLLDDPRLIVLCRRIEADLDQQTERIREILSRYDVDELLAPVMAFAETTPAGSEVRQ
ncbi:MAG: tetratricopeptide repeat protein, partial [Chromatiales bacterium]|nr:tetratricopeptide repeat protein [Chromatiales bacterium]